MVEAHPSQRIKKHFETDRLSNIALLLMMQTIHTNLNERYMMQNNGSRRRQDTVTGYDGEPWDRISP